nr:MAG TPA: CC FOXP coiled-coil domain protein [Caudoviricetes sp.]
MKAGGGFCLWPGMSRTKRFVRSACRFKMKCRPPRRRDVIWALRMLFPWD